MKRGSWWRRALGIIGVPGLLVLACGEPGRPPAAGDSNADGFSPREGPCATEGAVRECHVRLGSDDDALRCFVGSQECRGGAWSACGGNNITLTTVNLATLPPRGAAGGGGLSLLATPTPGGGSCAADPCDPYCVGYGEDAGIAPEAGAPSYYFASSSIFGGAPGGFVKKSDCGSDALGCNDVAPGAPYPRKCNGEDHYSRYDSCLADTHCDVSLNGGRGACVGNWDTGATADPNWDEANQRWVAAVCPGIDITVSAACEIGGVAGFNVCNRGNTVATAASIGIYLDNGNGEFGSSTFTSGTCPNEAPTCSPPVPGGALGPGKCFRVTNANCPAWDGSGNPVAYVNPNAAIAECGGLGTAASATAPGCNDNWADVKNKGTACGSGGASYAPVSKTFTYTASCPPGDLIRWKALTYNATVPCAPGACNGSNAGKVEFFGTLSTTLLDGATVTTAEDLIDDATTTKTVDCTFGTDAGGQPKCPVNLRTWADGVVAAGSTYAKLDLRILLTPTPDASASPTVNNWAVTYDCIPNE